MAPEEAESLALAGHRFILTGSCGTGKTYILREIITAVSKSINVAVTATTGMASLQLGLDASTLHHWAGIGDGRYSFEKLKELFDNDDKYVSARQRISSAQCLVIDEISMLSRRTFEMVEFVCRHVKQNNLCFGGLQVIGCGDFKQLPPVPDKYLNDEGEYCFSSPLFDITFPHHVHLTKVIRQNEQDLAKAVEELCDGSPTKATIDLLRSLSEKPDVVGEHRTRLYGTNFDARYMNEEMLDELDGESHVFRAKDEGNKHMLVRSSVPKTLLLKEGAPVILIKNLGGGLFNGQKGIVHKLQENCPPIINFNGHLHKMKNEKFEIFDANQNKVLASRTQIPIILAFAMTVHRAQGQTIENLEVDSSSFFAPGQLGVAVGRAVSKKGLYIRNLNMDAAFMKHPDCVYDFYKKPFKVMDPDKSCCSGNLINISTDDCPTNTPKVFPSNTEEYGGQNLELPRLNCPFNAAEFIEENVKSEFVKILTPDFISTEEFRHHIDYLYYSVNACIKGGMTTNTDWVNAYKSLNTFMVGNEHLNSIHVLFQVQHITKNQNKMSSKLALWLMDKIIELKASETQAKATLNVSDEPGPSVSQQEISEGEPLPQCSDAGSSKLRYIAGVCIHKIRQRLRKSVERNLGKKNKVSKLSRQIDYKKGKMLKSLSVPEDKVNPTDPTMLEIEFKQNKSRGLTVVNDKVFNFFKKLHIELQALLTTEKMHLNLDDVHNMCRNSIDSNNNLLSCWLGLFCLEDNANFEDEILLILLAELYQSVTEHFIRLSIVDSLKQFKRSIPKRKKQALRTKLQALGERSCSSVKMSQVKKLSSSKKSKKVHDLEAVTDDVPVCICPVCDNVCEEDPFDTEGESIGCDKCDKWFHYGCVNLTGNETFLRESNSIWFCQSCCVKGKGKGKGKGKSSKK